MQAYHQKTEKFFVSKEKKFYRIGYWIQFQVMTELLQKLLVMLKVGKSGILTITFYVEIS